MNATPRNLNLEEIKRSLEKIPGVCGIHYLHAWNVSSSSTAFSCHVEVADQPVSKTGPLAERIRHELFTVSGSITLSCNSRPPSAGTEVRFASCPAGMHQEI
jgi:Co/Zn/Cd efflux system component